MARHGVVRRTIGSRFESWHGLEPLEQRSLLSVAQGAEFLINSWTTDVQTSNSGAIAADAAGDFVSVWESLNQDSAGSYGVYGQRFMAGGSPGGAEFLVNTTVPGDQRNPAVAMSGCGAFVVAWEGQGTLGAFPGIYVQRYDAAGAAQGSEIAVAGTSLLSASEASVAMSASGAFVVAWEENGPSGRDIAARIFDANGSPVGTAFTVNQTTTGSQRQPQLVMDSSGNFAVTWNGNGAGDDAGVFARLFGPTGTPLTDEVLLNTTTAGTQSFSAIARDGDGEFMVAWSGNGTGDTAGVFARRMSAAGVPIGSEFRINATTTATQQRPTVAFDPDGDYVVTWSGFGTQDTSGIYGREYWYDDFPKAGEFAVNTTTPLIQINASVAATGDNQYAVTWNGPGAGDADGVFGRLFANVAPAVFTSGGSDSFVEDGAPVVIDWSLTVTDADSMIAGATARISGNYMPAEDSLVFNDQLGISGSWDAATGVLTLRGAAPAWDYQAALQSVTYVNSSQNPSAAPRTIVFAVNDGSLGSVSATAGVLVAPVNDAPVAAASAGSATYTVGGAAVAVDGGVALSDVDSAMLSSAVVQISGNFVAGEDSLVFNAPAGITGVWDAASGTLTLNGAASVAAYQAALQCVQYLNSSSDPSMAQRTVTMVVMDDAGAASSTVSRTIDVVAMTPPPPAEPPPHLPPCPPRRPVQPPCGHIHPAHPVVGLPHVPPGAHLGWRIDHPRGTSRLADGVLRIVAERRGLRDHGPVCVIALELHGDAHRGAMSACASGQLQGDHGQPRSGSDHPGGESPSDSHGAGEHRDDHSQAAERSAPSDVMAPIGPEDRGGGARGRGR